MSLILNMPCAKDEIENWSHDRQKETRHDPMVSVLSFLVFEIL